MTDQMQTPVAKLARLADAVNTIEDFLKSDDAPARVSVEKEEPMTNIPYMTEIDQLDQRQAELYHEEVKRLDAAYAALAVAERSKVRRESESQIKNRLMLQGGEFKANASRISELSKAGIGKVEKTDEPVLKQGTIADMAVVEAKKRAVELRKSEPNLSEERALAKVWQRDRDLWEKYEAHRGGV